VLTSVICFEYLGLTTHIKILKCPALVPGTASSILCLGQFSLNQVALNQFVLPLHPARFLLHQTKISVSSLKCQEDLTVAVQLSYCGLSCHELNRKLADSTSANSVGCRYAVTATPGDEKRMDTFFASDFIETDGAERVFCELSNAVYCSAAQDML